MKDFSAMEFDVIAELTNIGVGKAAASLSALVAEEIELTVPTCTVVPKNEALDILREQVSPELVGIKESFSGTFSGDGMLVFPQEDSLELVRTLVPNDTPLEMLTEMEQDALIEIGNIILNACIGTYGNMLKESFTTEIPEIVKGSYQDIFSSDNEDLGEDFRVLMIDVGFSINVKNVKGYVIFLMDLQSEALFRESIHNFVNQVAASA